MATCSESTDNTYLIQLSPLHTCNIDEERQRILANHGEIIDYQKPRVYVPKLYMPGLSISRSVGDICVKDYGVICEPVTGEIELNEQIPYLVMGSNGLYECTVRAELEKIIIDSMNNYELLETVTESVVSYGKEKWEEQERVIDDITAFLLHFDNMKDEVMPFSLLPTESQIVRADKNPPQIRNRLTSLPRALPPNEISEWSEI